MDSLLPVLIVCLLAAVVAEAFWIYGWARECRKLERELTTWRMDGETWLHNQKEDRKRVAELEERERELNDQLRSVNNGIQARVSEVEFYKQQAQNLNTESLTLQRQLQAFAERVRPVKKRRLQ